MNGTDHYDRDLLVKILTFHQRTEDTGCACGWKVIGASHADHVADQYEQARGVRRRRTSVETYGPNGGSIQPCTTYDTLPGAIAEELRRTGVKPPNAPRPPRAAGPPSPPPPRR